MKTARTGHSERINKLLEQLTVAEKAKLCSGADFWHLATVQRLDLPSIMVTDGPHGLRKQAGSTDHIGLNESVPATCFPTASGLAASWNRDLIEEVGVALGEECRQEGVSVLLGPGVNIKRHPLGGRNFEYFSEDPYLSGEMATAWVAGIQSQGVGASLKHYAVNNHEAGRMIVDAVVDERTLREIYLPAFEAVVRQAQPWTIMCSYNKLDGLYLSEHRKMLTEILRQQWHFEGLVMTDWGATHDRVLGIKAGLDLEMPSSGDLNTWKILQAVDRGELLPEELDGVVARVLNLILKSKQQTPLASGFSIEAHHQLAKRVATEACVLLKNESQLLPLRVDTSVAVIGALAKTTRYQGSGSSQIVPTRLEQPFDAISRLVEEEGGSAVYAEGYTLEGLAPADLLAEAVKQAENVDRVVLVVGLTRDYESEGFDRRHLELPLGQQDLIGALEPVHHKLVMVLQNGAPIALPEVGKVAAILEAYLGGQAGASAMADIIFGRSNPSGKLAETFPVKPEDIASDAWFPGASRQSQYREGIWVGYRYFDHIDARVAYPFGHGLSYTQYDYADMSVQGLGKDLFSKEDELRVSVRVKNTGKYAGAEVVQLYVGQANASVPRPKKELKAFSKIHLAAGEEKLVEFKLNYRSFAFWHCAAADWRVESDQFTVYIGSSVADIRCVETFPIQTQYEIGKRDPALHEYYEPLNCNFTDAAFEALLGYPVPPMLAVKPFQMNSTLREIQATWVGRQLFKQVHKMADQMLGEASEYDRIMIEAIVFEMPLRNLVANSQGKLSVSLMNRLIHWMNGDWLKCLMGSAVNSE
ncbi:MAG: glycosyl hydrolase [Gammaproteobacteria bacterium]|jgi:beta-glucosidase|nr:glycosyl hydrolase [Gammaproteobacteria bacterium]MBT5203426.1 glycosyl hydrolase [Gammaproteobacteria bacterium]MBT5602660.1 glycosyl hydrolase [Gammaproteobacteria bacterium]MBT6245649.1 glycosyl hydrolase [Gammaproteobacteria bacterium]